MNEAVKQAILKFVKGGIQRDIIAYNDEGVERQKITNTNIFLSFIEQYNGKKHIAIQVHPDLNIECGIYDTIFLDFDGENDIKNVYEEAKQIQSILGGRLYFSGRKGFHLYLDIQPVYLGNKYAKVLTEWAKQLKVKYLDLQCLKDKRRMARVVYTQHIGTSLYMIPVDTKSNITEILSEAIQPKKIYYHKIHESMQISNELRQIYFENTKTEEEANNTQTTTKIPVTEAEMPPCIRKCIETIRETGELDHYARFHMANYLIQMGWTNIEIQKIFEKYAKDYNSEKTEYQVNYLLSRNMHPFNCKNAMEIGLCPLEIPKLCPYYPSINKFIKILRGR
jgi:hypothetical protein